MEVAVDAYLAVPLLFTLLAVLVASLYLKFRPSDASGKGEGGGEEVKKKEEEEVKEAAAKVDESKAEDKPKSPAEDEREPEGGSEEPGAGKLEQAKGKLTVEDVGAADSPDQELASAQDKGNQAKQEVTRTEENEGIKKSPEDEAEVDGTNTPLPDDAADALVDEYRPGKIRHSSYEKTLTKDQLEEEQRAKE
ncbi:matrix-remodeling-associated protein 7 isoform X2 [Amblyraja radiata]|uniref:matrix-remodeling-associated protein 7 isoform X2 n=1 Tax=Amblyraja radiata TaxID=386614 RepID=UPI001402846F|nr:matrix-remodeling-associated protein 7 isoform X2 [Amblyraja radiata]